LFKDLKPHKDSSSQQLPPPLQQIILKVSLEASRADLLAEFVVAHILILD